MPESLFTLFAAPRATQEWHGDSEVSSNITAVNGVVAPSPRRTEKYRTPGLLLALCLVTSPRFAACALHSGFFVFVVTYIPMVLLVGLATRYFETFFGHWSLAGPGRAFRIIPVLEGIGSGMVVAAVIRAAVSMVLAAIALQYAYGALADPPLASTYCRNFEFENYQPRISKRDSNQTLLVRRKRTLYDTEDIIEETTSKGKVILPETNSNNNSSNLRKAINTKDSKSEQNIESSDFNKMYNNNSSFILINAQENQASCDEKLDGVYSNILQTPAYNYFYIEVLQLKRDLTYRGLNVWLMSSLAFAWFFIAMAFFYEILKWKKLVWTYSYRWLLLVPFAWIALLLVVSITQLSSFNLYLRTLFNTSQFGSFMTFSHALEMSLYTHACGIGSELINGKGLNNIVEGVPGALYTSLRGDVARTSAVTVAAAVLSALAASGCVGRDAVDHTQAAYDMHANGVASLWIIPLYSTCISGFKYSRLLNVFFFGGLAAMQLFVAYILMKTALHAIFEFRIDLAKRQSDVIFLTCSVCFVITFSFVTRGGPIFLECVDAVVTGLMATLLCALEMASMLWLYAGNDLITDLTAASTNSSHSITYDVMFFAWKMLPVMIIIALLLKIVALTQASMPPGYMVAASMLGMCIIFAIVATGAWNGYQFYKNLHARS